MSLLIAVTAVTLYDVTMCDDSLASGSCYVEFTCAIGYSVVIKHCLKLSVLLIVGLCPLLLCDTKGGIWQEVLQRAFFYDMIDSRGWFGDCACDHSFKGVCTSPNLPPATENGEVAAHVHPSPFISMGAQALGCIQNTHRREWRESRSHLSVLVSRSTEGG